MRTMVALTGACLALTGCGGRSNSAETSADSGSAAQRTVTISETEFSLRPRTVEIAQPGMVAFKVRNAGNVTHALDIEGNGVEKKTAEIQPGQSATLTVQLSKAGSYEMYCPIDSHKDKGMKGVIRVGRSSGAGIETGGGTTTNEPDNKDGSGY